MGLPRGWSLPNRTLPAVDFTARDTRFAGVQAQQNATRRGPLARYRIVREAGQRKVERSGIEPDSAL